jgi:hypothetical protein
VSWVERAEEALRGGTEAGVQVLTGGRPPILDADGRRALVTPFIAAFLWTAVVFREMQVERPLDPLALLLRLIALAFTVRAVLLLIVLAQRLAVLMRANHYRLALTDEGLLLRTPAADFAVPREDVLDVVEQGHWSGHSGRRWAQVYIVTRPDSGRLFLALPPVFERTPGVLAERLMRWRGVQERPDEVAEVEPVQLASKLFDAAAAGNTPPDAVVIRHGRGWLRRGPYATLLLGGALLDGFVRMPPEARATFGMEVPLVMMLCLFIVPLVWIVTTRREIAPRRGIALILTPAEVLMRTRAGVLRTRWSNVAKLEITSKTAWSVLHGARQSRTLRIERRKDPVINYTEEFLGAPAEVVLALCNAYRSGVLGTPPSQGSGSGGATSG